MTAQPGSSWGGYACIDEPLGLYFQHLKGVKGAFCSILEKNLSVNPLKCEYFLPFVVDELLKEGKAEVTVLKSVDRWYGVTYKEDKKMVTDAIQG